MRDLDPIMLEERISKIEKSLDNGVQYVKINNNLAYVKQNNVVTVLITNKSIDSYDTEQLVNLPKLNTKQVGIYNNLLVEKVVIRYSNGKWYLNNGGNTSVNVTALFTYISE